MSLRKNLVRAGVATAMVAAPIGGAVVNAAPAHASLPTCNRLVSNTRSWMPVQYISYNGSNRCVPNLSSTTYVKAIQKDINAALADYHSNPHLAIDGSYGPATRAAVRKFQQFSHISADGVYGATTNQYAMAIIESP